ncbi:MAG: threonyl-tRNA synthetase editing domain-containing protein, partial [Candidatus Nezhaarchaeales archaeon]
MKLLLIHADLMSYEVREKAVEEAEEISDDKRTGKYENSLVVFTAVEEDDVRSLDAVVDNASKEIIDVLDKVKAEVVVIYPYAHLSSNLAKPKDALNILIRLERTLRDQGVNVSRAPFGWYKSFTLVCKGHPLSELSKSIKAETKAIETAKPEVERGYFVLIEPSGEVVELDRERPHEDKTIE